MKNGNFLKSLTSACFIGSMLMLATGCAGTNQSESTLEGQPLEENTTLEAVSDEETTEENTIEESTTPPVPSEEAVVTEEATSEKETDPEESATEPVYQGDETLMLPLVYEFLWNWTIEGAEERDGVWYKDYTIPLVRGFDYVIYETASMDAASIQVPAFTPICLKGTDRENWLYIEALDKSICGWLPIWYGVLEETEEGMPPYAADYIVLMPEGETPIHLISFFIGMDSAVSYIMGSGMLSAACPLLEGLSDGDAVFVAFDSVDALAVYAEENAAMLEAEPFLKAQVDWLLENYKRSSHQFLLTYYKGEYAAPVWYKNDIWYDPEKIQDVIVLYNGYGKGSIIGSTGYFALGSVTKLPTNPKGICLNAGPLPETAELPTSISGEPLVSPEWVSGLHYEYTELLLPAARFVLPQWYVDGAVIKGDFYYKDSHYPFVNDFTYTIYAEPSLDSEKITVEPFTILYPQATDRLHWIYLESDDKNVCGWLSIEYEGIDYSFVPTEGADKRTLDHSFSGSSTRYNGMVSYNKSAIYGELNLDSALLDGLEEGKVKLLTFRDKEELQVYMRENRKLLEAEPEFAERLRNVLTFPDYDDEKIYVFLFKDRYSNPKEARYTRYFYDEQEKYVMFQCYTTDTVEEKPSAYFHIPYGPIGVDHLAEEDIMYLSVIQDPRLED